MSRASCKSRGPVVSLLTPTFRPFSTLTLAPTSGVQRSIARRSEGLADDGQGKEGRCVGESVRRHLPAHDAAPCARPGPIRARLRPSVASRRAGPPVEPDQRRIMDVAHLGPHRQRGTRYPRGPRRCFGARRPATRDQVGERAGQEGVQGARQRLREGFGVLSDILRHVERLPRPQAKLRTRETEEEDQPRRPGQEAEGWVWRRWTFGRGLPRHRGSGTGRR